MSQSPVDQINEQTTLRYRQGWRALNRLLHENRSFSGNELHCAFLNTGPGADGKHQQFADVSSAIGFDFADDGRGLAFCDWDFDGDLDVWTTSRTAPRVRFLRNSDQSENHFVTFLLQGNGRTTNRDAIGARLELSLNGDPTPVIKTLHAGQTFLSQSSRWIHFGLGANQKIDKLAILWPGGKREEFGGLAVDRFYKITQGEGVAIPWTPPRKNRVPLTPSTPVPNAGTDLARIVVPPGMHLPELLTPGVNGELAPYQRTQKGLFLVNLWASYCVPCLTELTEWGKAAADFEKAGIEVVALNTDSAGGTVSSAEARQKAERIIKRSKFPFPWIEAAPETVRGLNLFHHATIDLWKPLPVPSSFLVDAKGEVLVIYKGPVEAKQIIADAALATATPVARRDAAIPFRGGRWVEGPYSADSLRVASQFMDHDESVMAQRYLHTLVSTLAPDADDDDKRRNLGDTRYFYGILLEQSGKLDEAVSQLEDARALIGHDLRVRNQLAQLYYRLGKLPLATLEMEAAVQINPQDLDLADRLASFYVAQELYPKAIERFTATLVADPMRAGTRFQLAGALLESGQVSTAIEQYKETLRANPRLLEAANRLALLFTTHPDPKVRKGQEGLILASRLCTFTRQQNPRYLETLAGAQAEMKQFEQAVATAKKALALYGENPANADAAKALAARLSLFQAKQPYREEKWK